MGPLMGTRLVHSLVTTEALMGVFADGAFLQTLLDVEVSLGRVQARLGIIPDSAASVIASAAVAGEFDVAHLAREARASGTVVIPLVRALTARVRALDPEAARYVHWGATSQDVADTAFMLCVARAHDIISADSVRLSRSLRRRSDEHAATVMLGRTLLQPAPPVTLGLKVAGWYAAVARGGARLDAAAREACVVQFGGAAGTLAALGDRGIDVGRALATEVGLPWPGAPWHAHRDRLAAYVTACGVYVGSLGKIARDVSLLMQAEVAEVAEPGGGSSTMPHKRNPSGCALVLAAAERLPGLVAAFLGGMVQEHERGVGGWHAEWPTVSDTVQATGSAVSALAGVIEGLEVDVTRMGANIAATRGVVFAERAMMRLAPTIGRDVAHDLLSRAIADSTRTGDSFAAALARIEEVREVLTAEEMARMDEPGAYLGVAETLRQHLLAAPTLTTGK